jgi:NAD(P)-dependent dehydrogenase (short-subunit alcohol dehydrogenase family)
MKKLAEKISIVTGAGGGIGGAISRVFAAEGARVACVDVDAAAAEETVHRISEMGGEAIVCHSDVSNGKGAESAVRAVIEAFGALQILVNCAAVVTPTCRVTELSEEDWDRAFAVNLKSIFLMCKHAVPALIAAGGGNVINVASQLGHVGMPGRSAYCATKGGTHSLTRVLALDHADQNIRVNSLSPGQIATQRGVKQYGSLERLQEIRAPLHPIGRIGTPEEVARAALFLACDDSSFMTGADLLIDGGYTAQ